MVQGPQLQSLLEGSEGVLDYQQLLVAEGNSSGDSSLNLVKIERAARHYNGVFRSPALDLEDVSDHPAAWS